MVFEFACNHDIDSWMELLELVKENFPGLVQQYKSSRYYH